MSNSIITTKLYTPPTRTDLVPRSHLIERLNRGLTHKLTLVSAPAGFGKTTLISSWLRQADRPAVWLSLDESDNDLIRFMGYVITALQKIDEQIGQAAQAMLQHPQLPPTEALMTTLVNDVATAAAEFIFVLDDYHVIDALLVHDVLNFLLTHLPPSMHLVITSRADPPLSLSRLRAQGRLNEVRIADLRFQIDEAHLFLNQTMRLALTPDDVMALENRTEGWIAGLQLAGLSLQGLSALDKHNFVTTFAGDDRYVVDYLLEEVLHRQPPEMQDFLLQTSILDRLCGPLCDVVLSRGAEVRKRGEEEAVSLPSSQKMLETLERANLFTVPLDNRRQWYRYHHLFGDLLRYRLHERFPERVATLHHRASEWFEENGSMEEAVEHALSADAYERAAELIEQSAHALFSGGKMPLIQQWMTQLSTTLIRAKPRLYMVQGWLLFRTGQFDGFEAHLQTPPTINITTLPSVIQGEYLILQAHSAFISGHFDDCQQMVTQALSLLAPENLALRMPATTLLAWSSDIVGDLSKAIRYHQQVMTMGYQADALTGIVASLSMLVQIYAYQKDHHQAMATFTQAHQFASERGVQWIPLLGPAYIGVGHVYYQQGRVDDAIQNLQEGISRCRRWGGLSIAAMRGYTVLAEILQKEKRVEEAQNLLVEAKHFAQMHKVPDWAMDFLSLRQPIAPRLIDPLTRREREVLRLLMLGHSSPQIADELIIGVSTVRTHIKRIYGKLEVHSRAEAIARAHELELV